MIHNATPTGVPAASSTDRHKINATLTEYSDRYEHKLRISQVRKRNLAACIRDGVLAVYEESGTDTIKKTYRAGMFFVPANVQQTKIRGFFRNYGLKIVMPPGPGNGPLIKVSLIRETDSGSSPALHKQS